MRFILFGLGVVAVIAAVALTYRLDERLGCDLGDRADDCIASGVAALKEWFSASSYERFLVSGADHEAFVEKAKASCVIHHKQEKLALDKTDQQLAVFCGCWAINLGALASARDVRYIARHEQPPASLQRRLTDLAPDCANLADSILSARPN